MKRAIEGQVMVITGASSGIGLATARAAAARGAKVALAARNARDLERAAEDIVRAGGDAVAVPTDVSVFEQVEHLAVRTLAAWGRIDTWVNNAAVSAYAPFVDQPLQDFERVLQVNFLGQVYGAKAALPHLERTDGALVCVGSTLSDRGVPLQGAYCAAKHALKGWLDTLRVELEQQGSRVRVSLIKPSSINTPLFNKAKTQLGVMPQPIPPVYDPELAAAAILRAAEGRARDVFVGGSGKVLSVAERISPKLVDVHQRLKGFDSQKSPWPKAVDEGNLYAPLDHDGGVQGDFLRGSHRRSVTQSLGTHRVMSPMVAAAAMRLGASAVERKGRPTRLGTLLRMGSAALLGKAAVAALLRK